jgi:hypothetical protein
LADSLPALTTCARRTAVTRSTCSPSGSGGDVVAVEIKSSSAPTRGDARHLEWLRDQIGERFLAGAVLHTGPRPFHLSERIFALPIATLWG